VIGIRGVPVEGKDVFLALWNMASKKKIKKSEKKFCFCKKMYYIMMLLVF